MVTKSAVNAKLREVLDPELGINIVDLGLIYETSVKKNSVFILMTLTFPGCPLGTIIHKSVNEKIKEIPEVEDIKLEITFSPPWDLSKISPEARLELGM